MQLNQARYFMVTARLLNFTKAAAECCVSQPALTKGIKNLEDELGGPLFHRVPQICLTDLGRRMLPFIEQTVEAANAVRQQAHSYRTGEIVPISIGLDRSVRGDMIKPMLSELTRTFSGLSIRLRTGPDEKLLEALLGGEIDIVVRARAGAADRDLLHHVPLMSERHVIVCAADHEFAQTNALELDMLLNAPDRILFCTITEGILETLGRLPPPRHHAESAELLGHLIDIGAGWALLPADHPLAREHPCQPLPEPRIERLIEIAFAAGRRHTSAVSAFLRMARVGPRPLPIAS